MVKTILLPKAALAAEKAVDFCRREVFPRFTLSKHDLRVRKCRHEMDMVGHHDEISQLIAITVKVTQAVRNDQRELGPAEDTSAVAFVEVIVPAIGQELFAFAGQGRAERSYLSLPIVRGCIYSMLCKPGGAFCLPLAYDFLRQRIPCAPRNKSDGSRLRPMRQAPVDHIEFLGWIEHFHWSRPIATCDSGEDGPSRGAR